MRKQYRVTLTEDERTALQRLLAGGTAAARTLTRVRILLKADEAPGGPGWSDRRIAVALDTSRPTVERVRTQFAQEGLAATLVRRRPATTPGPMLAGRQEAHLVALACSAPPAGRQRWTLRLLADRFVELAEAEVETLSYETVRRVLKQTPSSRGKSNSGASRRRPTPSSSGGWRTCSTPTPARTTRAIPQVCLDEASTQLLEDVTPSLPAAPGQPAREDYEYARRGTANLFLVYEPMRSWRHVTVTDRRARVDFAHIVKDLVDVHYPDAERIVLVLDNLNTHSPASLYEAFEPAEAKRLADKLGIRHTPKHGSWLNMAEIELSVLARQCLGRRLPDRDTLAHEVAAWEAARNASSTAVDLRFTTSDARIKLKCLNPSNGL